VFDNRVLRRIFVPKRDEETGEWRKLHNELNDLYSSANIVRVIKLRRMRWTGHVACIGKGDVYTEFWWGNLRGRDHWGDPGIDGSIRWIFRNWDGGMDWIELAQDKRQVASTCDCSDEPSGSIKCGEFLD
jgi:hypothetical protein